MESSVSSVDQGLQQRIPPGAVQIGQIEIQGQMRPIFVLITGMDRAPDSLSMRARELTNLFRQVLIAHNALNEHVTRADDDGLSIAQSETMEIIRGHNEVAGGQAAWDTFKSAIFGASATSSRPPMSPPTIARSTVDATVPTSPRVAPLTAPPVEHRTQVPAPPSAIRTQAPAPLVITLDAAEKKRRKEQLRSDRSSLVGSRLPAATRSKKGATSDLVTPPTRHRPSQATLAAIGARSELGDD